MASTNRTLGALAKPIIRRTTALPVPPRSCLYHSYDHPSTTTSYNTSENAILSAAYSHVPEHGFSQRALALGAKEIGFPDISTSILPNGVFSLIRYHLVSRREELSTIHKQIYGNQADAKSSTISDKVERLTWERLLANQNIIRRWQEALAVMAQPSYAPASFKELALLSDEIWFLAGDTAVDPSWYTKRGSLATIYASTELFMTNDHSLGFNDTRDFLNRRLGEVKGVGSVLGSLGQWVGFTTSAGVNILRSKGVRV